MHDSVRSWIYVALTANDIQDRRVLEVGSGDVNGTIRPIVARHEPAEYLGVDMAPGRGVDRVVDCTRLVDEFGAGSWDVVVTTEMLEHVSDWRASIRNLIQVVKPGGLLVITTRSPGFPYHPFPEDHWRYTKGSFERILSNARLEQLIVVDDPEPPGVFVKARKPEEWRTPRGNPWVGVDVEPVRSAPQGVVMPEDKSAPAKAAGKTDDRMIAALLRERAGYEAVGKADRVAQVDEQLVHYGYQPDGASARKRPPQGRSARPQDKTGD